MAKWRKTKNNKHEGIESMGRRPGVEIARNLLGRRDFLKIAGATAVLPSILTAQAKGQTAKSSTPANNRINIGVIGMGWQGPANTQALLALDDCQIVAACDVDRNHLQAADNTGPLEVEGSGALPPANAVWNTAQHYRFELKYRGGVTMTVAGGHPRH